MLQNGNEGSSAMESSPKMTLIEDEPLILANSKRS